MVATTTDDELAHARLRGGAYLRDKLHREAARTPWWQRVLLTLATMVFAVGLAGVTLGWVRGGGTDPAAARTAEAVEAARQQGRQFVDEAKLEEAKAAAKGWYERASPHLLRLGLSFVAGFVLGFAFRAFVKTTAAIAALVLGAILVGSYFQVVDLGGVEASAKSFFEWLGVQGKAVYELAKGYLPSTIAGGAGAAVGFVRRP